MDNLVKSIQALVASDVQVDKEGGNRGYFSEHPLVDAVVCDASGALIHDGGRPHFSAMEQLAKRIPGCQVVAGETDGFGWLTGVIVLPNGRGRVVYG